MQKVSTQLIQNLTIKERTNSYEQRFHTLVDPSGTPIAITDLRGRFTYANKALAKLLGYSVEELVGRPFKNFVHPGDRGRIIRLFMNIIMLRRQPRAIEFRAINKDKDILYLWTRPTRLVINGKTVGFQAIIVDVTEHKKAEQELLSSRENYEHTTFFLNEILSNMSDYVFVIDEDYAIQFLNNSAKTVYGASVGKKCYEIVRNRKSPCHASGIPCEISEIIHKGKNYFEDTRLATAIRRITHTHAKPIRTSEGKKAILSVSRDLTEEIQAKEKIERYISLLHATIEATPDGILVVDENKKITHYNQKWVQLFNVPANILKSRDDRKLLNYVLKKMKDPEPFLKKTRELYENPDKETLDIFEWKDGKIYERHSRPHRIKKETTGRVITLRDITERRQMEDKIKRYSQHLEKIVEEKTRELMISENFLKTIFEGVPDHLYIIDKDSKFVFVNKSYCEFHAKSKEDILGKDKYSLYPKVIADIFTSQDRKVFRTGLELHTSDTPIRGANGSLRRIYTIKVPLKDVEGNVTHILGITRDITQIKRTEEYLEKTFNLSVDMICILGIDGYLKRINTAFEKILGWTSKELLSKPFLELIHPEDVKKTNNVMNNCISKKLEIFNLQIRMRCKDKSYKWLSWTGKFLHEDNMAIATARDVTEEKKLEDMKNQFISVTTHELRTPLGSIIAYLELALSGKLGGISEKLESALQVMKKNSKRILDLSNDLLDLKRIESGNMKLNLETIDLKELIKCSTMEVQPLINEKRQNLTIELPENALIIQGDYIRINQVLINLLSNANKFTPENGNITIKTDEKKKYIQIIVSDTGIGIKKKDLRGIFKPFSNVQKPSYFKGVGLGLNITRGLVKLHGGKIKAISAGEGKGTTFFVTLPKLRVL